MTANAHGVVSNYRVRFSLALSRLRIGLVVFRGVPAVLRSRILWIAIGVITAAGVAFAGALVSLAFLPARESEQAEARAATVEAADVDEVRESEVVRL